MPIGLRFQRKHKRLGYKIKYIYYFLFRRDILQKRTSYGEENPDKVIYIIKPDYQDGVEGLLSLIYSQVLYIDIAKKKGYVPFVDWKNYKTQYYDGVNNAWEFFFAQPSNLQEADAYKSKRVFVSGWTFKNINPNGLFESDIFFNTVLRKGSSNLLQKYLRFSNEVNELVKREAEKLKIEQCIGVYIRGTDYIKLQPSGEYVQPSLEQVIQQMDFFVQKYDAPIFLVTEDGEIYDEINSFYSQRLRVVSYDSFVRDYDGKNVLSKSNVLDEDKKKRGQKYLVKMILLAKCKYLVSSITQGSKFSYALNAGHYEDEFIFDLGLYP